jgi:4-amino-4-deoxy-L-arabinose transferase-like glycosyltransferase
VVVRRARRIPAPLLALLVVVVVEGLAWTFAVPALQGADEGAHLSYVTEIARDHEIPWRHSDYGLLEDEYPPSVSKEQATAWVWAGLEPLRGNRAARPLWTETDEAIWRARDATLSDAERSDAIGSQAWRNPPLYYLSAAVPYAIAGGSLFDRLYAVRLYNVVLLLATVALTWLLAGEVFGRRRALQAVAAGAVALHPTLLDVMTRVTPDALLSALAASALYLMALVVRRGPQWRLVLLLALAVVAAALTQARGLGLAVPAAFAVGLAWWRRPESPARGHGPSPRPALRWLAWAGVAAAMLVAVAFYATGWQLRELPGFWSYLWQFYLPALPGMTPPNGPEWDVSNVYLDRFLATFVQFEVGFPDDLRAALRLAVYAGLALVAVAAVRHRDALRERLDVVAVLVVALVLSILALHAAAFREMLQNPVDPIITGRYLLMLIPLFGVGVAAATTALPGRVRALGTGALVAAMALLQLSALGIVVARFYA